MKDSIIGIIRHLLTFGGGIMVTKGLVDEGTATELVGAFVTVLGGAWSIYDKMTREEPEA